MDFVHQIGLVASIVMPLFNIPLIIKIVKRRSSEDISIPWAMGVWICCLLMAPSGVTSSDIIWRSFNIVNLVLFSAVVFVVLKYRKKSNAS